MSQDTYEVIVECMNLDPNKRSLVGARDALCRLVSFTVLDEALDDFCGAERTTVATANREPLRTPSIQSPYMDQGTFPWAKALHASPPQPIRQLSAIPDDESYTEDLFPKSEGTRDWFSGSVQTPSISSVLTSNLGASMDSLAISRPMQIPSRAGPKVSPMAGSLPINMSKPRPNFNAMSMVFGRQKDAVSKSWSDMYDEDNEDDEEDLVRELQELKQKLNSRTWSQDGETNATPTLQDQVSRSQMPASVNEKLEASPVNDTFSHHIDSDLVADGFFFQEAPAVEQPKDFPPRYSPPSKRSATDKWVALGQHRRAVATPEPKSPDYNMKSKRQFGYSFNNSHGVFNNSHGVGIGAWDHANQNGPKGNRAKSRDCPWNQGRDRHWRKEKRHDFEWVGNWHDAH